MRTTLRTRANVLAFALALTLPVGCGEAAPVVMEDAGGLPPDAGPMGIAVLGGGTHDPSTLDVTDVVTTADAMSGPRDVAFRPDGDHELWITNGTDSSMVIVSAAGTPEQTTVRHRSFGTDHFMPHPAALAFGEGTMATIQEMDEVTQHSTPADFMGPSLWPSDPTAFDGGEASHLDMLHNSPNGVGIEWESGNVFWVFDGAHQSLTRYNFNADHGPGGTDHTDGEIVRYVEGQVGYVPGVCSHLVLDHASGLLYVADTGNHRVAVLETGTGTPGADIGPDYDGAFMYEMEDATLTTLVDGAALGLDQPSGIALANGMIFVTDHGTSRIHAFDLAGAQLDYLDLSSVIAPGSLSGIAVDPEGRLYVVDTSGERVVRIATRP